MFRFLFSVIFALILSALLVTGCGSSGNDPLSPSDNRLKTGVENSDKLIGNHGEVLWGLFDIFIDETSGEAGIVPVRTPLFEANVTRFLQPPLSPMNLLQVAVMPETNFPSGYVVCDVTISHPFPGTQYSGFDVRGIVMGETGKPCKWDTDLNYSDETTNSVMLLNPDGWTRWWNQTEFTTYGKVFGYTEGSLANPGFTSQVTLNPYKYFADELGSDDSIEILTNEGRGFFSSESPGINTRRYELQFPLDPTPKFFFKYAITANWTVPKAGAVAPWTPDDFELDANQAEAFRIIVTDKDSTAYYVDSSTYGGDIEFKILVSDWQLLDGSSPDDQIAGIYIESPTLFPGFINIFSPGSYTLVPEKSGFQFSVKVTNVMPKAVENQIVIFHVLSMSPNSYKPQIPDPSGFDYPQYAFLAAHTMWTAPISPDGPAVNLPPVADASASEPTEGHAPLMVNLDPSLSYDPDGYIVLYEWDLENDGFFDVSTVAPDIVSHEFSLPGSYEVNLRVTDNEGAWDELDSPLIIKVTLPAVNDFSQLQDDPSHTGDIAEETVLYPPLKIDWSEPLTSTSAFWIEGTPIVGDGHVMVLYTDSASNWAECFNATTGAKEWLVNISPSGKQSYIGTQTGAFGSGLFFTPGDQIRGIDPSSGEVVWFYNPNKSETERHGLVYRDGQVMVHLSNQIHILDAIDGSVVNIVNVAAGWANFQPFTLRDDIAYIQLYGQIRSYNLQTGTQLWSFSVDPPIFGSDTSVRGSITAPGDGKVYFGCYNGYYYAVNDSNGSLVWKTPINGGTLRQFDTGAYWNGFLYYGEGTGNTDETEIPRLVCLDASDGSEVWGYHKDDANSGDSWGYCTPIVVNGIVYAGCRNGEFVGLDAITGDLVWSYQAPAVLRSDPSVADGRLYLLCEDRMLRCFVSDD